MNATLRTFAAILLSCSSLVLTPRAEAGDYWHHGGGPYVWGPPLPAVVFPPPPPIVIGFPPVVIGAPFYGQPYHDHGWHRGWSRGRGHWRGHGHGHRRGGHGHGDWD